MSRILLDAEAAEGGGNTPTPPPPPPTPAGPAKVELPADEVARLYAAQRSLEDFQRQARAREEAAEQARLKALAEKEGAETALRKQKEARDAEVAAFAEILAQNAKKSSLAETLAASGAKFRSPAAAQQVMEILGNRIEAVFDPVARQATVRDRATLQPADVTIRSLLASPDFEHFLEPTSQGGSGSRPNPAPPPPPDAAPVPTNLGEFLVAQMAEALAEKKAKSVPFQF